MIYYTMFYQKKKNKLKTILKKSGKKGASPFGKEPFNKRSL